MRYHGSLITRVLGLGELLDRPPHELLRIRVPRVLPIALPEPLHNEVAALGAPGDQLLHPSGDPPHPRVIKGVEQPLYKEPLDSAVKGGVPVLVRAPEDVEGAAILAFNPRALQ